MNGQEYERLFKMAQEGRDAALTACRELATHGDRLTALEKKVGDNNMALAVGRFGVRAAAWAGSLLIGLGALLLALLEWLGRGGNSGPS